MIRKISIEKGVSVAELLDQFAETAFNARRLGEAGRIYTQMLEENAFIFFSLAGAMMPAGMGNVVRGFVENDFVDAIVTTGANVTHEIADALGYSHFKGDENADDVELSKRNVNRIYDVYIENEAFEGVESFVSKIFQELEGRYSSFEIVWSVGRNLPKTSFLRICYEKKIPVFCPTLHDSILGLHLYIHGKKLVYDPRKDVEEIVNLCFQDEKMGALIVGGGVPKNFVLQAMLLGKGFDYAIQITTDSPHWGGLSGATLDEAKSWCKLTQDARSVTVYCDATIALPILYAYLLDRSQQENF